VEVVDVEEPAPLIVLENAEEYPNLSAELRRQSAGEVQAEEEV